MAHALALPLSALSSAHNTAPPIREAAPLTPRIVARNPSGDYVRDNTLALSSELPLMRNKTSAKIRAHLPSGELQETLEGEFGSSRPILSGLSPFHCHTRRLVLFCPKSERPVRNRMDRRDLEPCKRLHKDKPWLCALLRGGFRRALPGCRGAPLRAGVRPPSCPRETSRTPAMAAAANDLRELNERSVSRRSPRRLHRSGRVGDAARELAHISSAHETIDTSSRSTSKQAAYRC